MNIARSSSQGFWWHVAAGVAGKDGTGGVGIYIRVGERDGVVIPRDEAAALIDGLREVLGELRS